VRGRLREEADWALAALGAAGIAVFARTAGDQLEPLESHGALRPEQAQAMAQQYRGSLLERALEGVYSQVTLPARPDGVDPPVLHALRTVGVRVVLAVPLRDAADDETAGVVVAAWHERRPHVDRTVVTRIAAHLALAIAYARQQTQLEGARWSGDLMQQAIHTIMQQVVDCADEASHKMDTIIAHAAALLEARAGAVALTQDGGATVCYAAVHNLPQDLLGTCVPAGEGLIGRVLATGQPVLLDEESPLDGADRLREACDTPHWIAVPITAQGKVQGVLSLAVDPRRRCSARDTAILLLFARFCGASLRMMRLLARARQAAAMEQRRALARDLHDSVTQTVFSLQLAAQVALDNWAAQPAQAREALEMVLRLALGASAEMRTLLFELRENALESEGLARALERYVAMVRHRSALPVDVQVDWARRLPAPYEEVLYRVAQEALTNIVKHARAARARVVLAADTTRVSLYVADDGIGCATAEPAFDSYGLVVMREGVSALGGTLRLGNRPEGGAYVALELPLPEETL
jgi:signal transduction histidine kinase